MWTLCGITVSSIFVVTVITHTLLQTLVIEICKYLSIMLHALMGTFDYLHCFSLMLLLEKIAFLADGCCSVWNLFKTFWFLIFRVWRRSTMGLKLTRFLLVRIIIAIEARHFWRGVVKGVVTFLIRIVILKFWIWILHNNFLGP